MPALVLTIDAAGARSGAQQWGRSAEDIRRKAGVAAGSMTKVEGAAKRFRKTLFSLKGPILALGAGFGFALLARKTFGVLADFSREMAGVKAISGATGAEFSRLTNKARELGGTTQFTAIQAAKGLRLFSLAGFSVQESLDAIGPTLKLAIAGELGLAEAVDIAAAAIRAFGLEATESSRIADVLAKTATSANTTVAGLGEGMKFAAPAARVLGVDIETTAAAMGVLADAGLKATLGGTGLRQVFLKLINPTKQAEETLAKYGLTAADVDVTQRGLIRVLETLGDANLSAADAVQIFEARAFTAFSVLSGALPKVRALTEANKAATGTVDEMARIIEDNLRTAAIKLTSAFEEMILQTGDRGLGTALRDLIDTMTGVLQAINQTIDPTDEANKRFFELAGTIELLTKVLIGMVAIKISLFLLDMSAAAVSAAVSWRKLGFAMRATPVGLIATAIGLATVAWLEYGDQLKITQGAQDTVNTALENTAALLDKIRGKADAAGMAQLRASQQAAMGQALEAVALSRQRVTETRARLATMAAPGEAHFVTDPLVRQMAQDDLRQALSELRQAEDRIGLLERQFAQQLALARPIPAAPPEKPLSPAELQAGAAAPSKATTDVIEALAFEVQMIGKTSLERQKAILLRKAEVAATDDLGKVIVGLIETLDQAAKFEKILTDTIDAGKKAREESAKAEAARELATRNVIAGLQIEATNERKLLDARRKGTAALREADIEIRTDQALRQAGITLYDDEARRIEELVRKTSDLREENRLLQERMAQMNQIARDVSRALGEAFDKAIFKGESLTDVLGGLAEALRRLIFEIAVLEPLERAIRSSFGGGGGGGGIGGIFSIFSSLLPFFGGGGLGPQFTGVGTAALLEQGSFEHGGSFVVPPPGGTDTKPVFFNASPGERVTVETAQQQRRQKGGDTYIIDATGADEAGMARLFELIASLNGTIEQRAVAAVVAARGSDPGLFGQ